MRNVLNLGTFEYGTRAKWSTLIVVCCFLVLLTIPTMGYAVVEERWQHFRYVSTRVTTQPTTTRTWFARVTCTADSSSRPVSARLFNSHLGTTNGLVSQRTITVNAGRTGTSSWTNTNLPYRWRATAQPNVNNQLIRGSVAVQVRR